jgi:hypothetical protein
MLLRLRTVVRPRLVVELHAAAARTDVSYAIDSVATLAVAPATNPVSSVDIARLNIETMYILANERDGSVEEMKAHFVRYERYLAESADVFPPSAYALATSRWWYDFSDHRCPHDAWLEECAISEPSSGSRQEIRSVSIRVSLLGAYHDGFIELVYPKVYKYEMSFGIEGDSHSDWRYDEFRLTSSHRLVHEIEWSSGAHWIIEADDLLYKWTPR